MGLAGAVLLGATAGCYQSVDVWPTPAPPTPLSSVVPGGAAGTASAGGAAEDERELTTAWRKRAPVREARQEQVLQKQALQKQVERKQASQKRAAHIALRHKVAQKATQQKAAQQKVVRQKLALQKAALRKRAEYQAAARRRAAEERALRQVPVLRPGEPAGPKIIYLTFDDGPSVVYTSQVLALLRQYGARAVFCQVGTAVRAHPEITRQIVAAGHTLCDHTMTHDQRLRHREPATIRREIDGGLTALHEAAPGVPVPFFRAPGGNWSPELRAAARRDQMANLTWTIDPRDWSKPGVAHILAVVRAERRDRAVLLMHDGGGAREQTIAALTVLLPELTALGYRFEVPPPAMFTTTTTTR